MAPPDAGPAFPPGPGSWLPTRSGPRAAPGAAPSASRSARACPPARSAPRIPARTSPLPAVAIQDGPESTQVRAPSGVAMTVVAPLRSTVAPVARARSRAWAPGAASTASRATDLPVRAVRRPAASPACGVSTWQADARPPPCPSARTDGRRPRAPASTTAVAASSSARARAVRTWLARSPSAGSVPGPRTRAWLRPSAGTTSGRAARTRSSTRRGATSRTMPAPVRAAAEQVRTAAPG